MFAVLLGWLRGLRPDYRKHLMREKDEVLVAILEHHLVAYSKAVLIAVGALLLWLVPLLMTGRLIAFPVLLGAGLLAWAAYEAAEVYKDIVVVTNLRVFKISGIFTKKRAYIPTTRILDITVVQPLWGRVLDYGHFIFESAAQEQGLREVRHIRHFARREAQILDVVHPRKKTPPVPPPPTVLPGAQPGALPAGMPEPRRAADDPRGAAPGGGVLW